MSTDNGAQNDIEDTVEDIYEQLAEVRADIGDVSHAGRIDKEPLEEQVTQLLTDAAAGKDCADDLSDPRYWRTKFARKCPRGESNCACRRGWDSQLKTLATNVQDLCATLRGADPEVRQLVAAEQKWVVEPPKQTPNEEGMSAALRRVCLLPSAPDDDARGIATATLKQNPKEDELRHALERICDLDPEPEDEAGHTARGIAAEALARFTNLKE